MLYFLKLESVLLCKTIHPFLRNTCLIIKEIKVKLFLGDILGVKVTGHFAAAAKSL